MPFKELITNDPVLFCMSGEVQLEDKQTISKNQ